MVRKFLHRKTKRARPGRHVTAPRKTYRSATKHTRKANTPTRERQWEHVYSTARKEGFKEADAIKIANGVVKKTVTRVRKNPFGKRRPKNRVFGKRPGAHFLIEALCLSGNSSPSYLYYSDGKFTSNRERATKYHSKKDAWEIAKSLRISLPDSIRSLRIVPA